MSRALFLTLLCASLPVGAQPAAPTPEAPVPPVQPTITEADRLFEEGRELAKAGDHAAACERFAKSLELDHSIGTELNLADCHEKLGHLREAWRLFTAAANESARSADAKRTQFARERAAGVASKLATVVVRVEKPTVGLAITIAGRPVDPATEIIDLEEPGFIEVNATLPGHPPFNKRIEGIAGTTVHVTIPAFADVDGGPRPVALRRQRGRVRLAWGLGAGGAAVGIAATVFAFKGRSDYNATASGPHCSSVVGGIVCDSVGRGEIDSAQRLADIGTILAASAGALFVGATVVYLTSPYEPMTVTPTVSASGAGLSLRGQW